MIIALTGATGLIGTALCAALTRAGATVLALTRDPARAARRLPGVRALAIDDALKQFPECDIVVNLAGESVAGLWTNTKKRAIYDSRVIGTRRLVDAIGRAPVKPKTLVSASAVGYYGDRGDEPLPETAGPGSGFLATVVIDWEREAQRAETFGVRVALARISVVLAQDGGALASLRTPFSVGFGGPVGSGQQWFPWIHLDDCVGLLQHCIERDDMVGPINVVAPGIVRQAEFARELGRALGRPAIVPAPSFALRLMLGEFSSTLLGSQRQIPERALATGYRFQYPTLPEALRSL
ncbi:MAG: TIGR01777 family oxidoreductase, partial [Dehalococcoidia bacterium]|nr:TIGR01777 family oxidoreductase [Dehalococcoidia bacterium]